MVNSFKKKKFLIFGTGAVGGYYGGMLVKAGFDVTFIARGKNYKVLKEKGLTLIRNGKRENSPIRVVETIHELSKDIKFDYIIICVKGQDTRNVAETIKEYVNSSTTVVSFQNGVENEEIISEVIGKEKVIGGLVFVAVQMTEPGTVCYVGDDRVVIGELNGQVTSRITDLQKILELTGTQCTVSNDIFSDMWTKLIWNAAFNPLSVLTGKTSDKIVQDKELWEFLKNIMTEVRNVAVSLGLKIRPDYIDYYYERSINLAGFKTSMLQDFERGNPIELEGILGVVIRKAKQVNMPVPNLEKLYQDVEKKITVKKAV